MSPLVLSAIASHWFLSFPIAHLSTADLPCCCSRKTGRAPANHQSRTVFAAIGHGPAEYIPVRSISNIPFASPACDTTAAGKFSPYVSRAGGRRPLSWSHVVGPGSKALFVWFRRQCAAHAKKNSFRVVLQASGRQLNKRNKKKQCVSVCVHIPIHVSSKCMGIGLCQRVMLATRNHQNSGVVSCCYIYVVCRGKKQLAPRKKNAEKIFFKRKGRDNSAHCLVSRSVFSFPPLRSIGEHIPGKGRRRRSSFPVADKFSISIYRR